ncbi:DciA family protein [Hydrocarboniphaga sp.]|uniref:DciA family protein n=1 Tax=Hydrocarboniphaga sp. TaxID=2033016 RepID=UPI003D0E30DF
MQNDAPPLLSRLRTQASPLRDLIDHAERISALDQALRQWTPEPWFQAIRLANIRGDTVVLFASNAAALVPLRYRQQALLSYLREHLRIPCTRLETKVKPDVHKTFTAG